MPKFLIIEPFYGGSHKTWVNGLTQFSQHCVGALTLPGRHWKWRMRGGAVELSRQYIDKANDEQADCEVFVVTDMIDLACFQALTKELTSQKKWVLYMHENQITYPENSIPNAKKDSANSTRDFHYGFTNFTSMLCADQIWFNSRYHYKSFFAALPNFLQRFPDNFTSSHLLQLQEKSSVVPLGIDLHRLDLARKKVTNKIPILLWNHRWEYDKNQNNFSTCFFLCTRQGTIFRLFYLANSTKKSLPSLNVRFLPWVTKYFMLATRKAQRSMQTGYGEQTFCRSLPYTTFLEYLVSKPCTATSSPYCPTD